MNILLGLAPGKGPVLKPRSGWVPLYTFSVALKIKINSLEIKQLMMKHSENTFLEIRLKDCYLHKR